MCACVFAFLPRGVVSRWHAQADSERLLQEYDANKDGRLQFKEFLEYCKASLRCSAD